MKTANLAIVFTDIKDFTARTSQQTYEQNQRMLRVHDALLMPVFKSFGGRLVKTIGDAFLVVFESPTQAVLCGVAIQDRLWDYNRRVPEAEAIRVRVAVNMGEVRVEKGDVFGEPVNIAARVEGIAEAGEVLFTEAVYLAMNKAEVPSEERGLFELKGIPEKVRVYRVPQGDYRLASATPAPREAASGEAHGGPAHEGPPYGGLALARLQALPPPDPKNLEGSSELLAHLGALAEGAARGLKGAGQRSSALAGRLSALPRSVRLGAAALAAGAIAACLLVAALSNPIERALGRGDFELAREQIDKLEPGARKVYFEGRLREERGDWEGALRRYERAAKGREDLAFERLVGALADSKCQVRAQAARSLARLDDLRAIPALEDLKESSFADESGEGVLHALFGCDSRRSAREAIEYLQRKRN
ncbi:MAG: adenylate/guanylate cyclase domain-containing protein [Myxococcales bacterium]|jgi:adenylate cyclase